MSKDTTHSPGPCGCRIVSGCPPGQEVAPGVFASPAVLSYRIEYCPKHAAAPDMLKALKAIRHAYTTPGISVEEQTAAQAEADDAIDKAEGRRGHGKADSL